MLGAAHLSSNFTPLATAPFSPNAWLELSPEGDIKIWCGKSELGQGVRTALPMIVAEELCCEWRRVRVVQADLEPKYGERLTGGSLSVRTSYQSLRKAGAAAREMLISAAAAEWNVSRSECRAESSFVRHAPTQRKLAFEQLLRGCSSSAYSRSAVEESFGLYAHWQAHTPRRLTRQSNRHAKFGLDTRLPGMLIASMERSPV